jgi:hypothetical protein
MKVTFNNPAFAKGTEFEIPGVGLVINGEEIDITKEQQETFEEVEGWKFDSNDGAFKGTKGGDE